MPVRMAWFDDDARDKMRKRATLAVKRAAAFGVGSVRQEITSQNLIDTSNLLNSIADSVVNWDRGRVATNVFYAIYLEYGTRQMPAKAFMRRGMEHDASKIKRVIQATMAGG